MISLPRFSASSRSGMKAFMQSSPGPACVGGAALKAPAPPIGAAPFTGKDDCGAVPTEAVGAEPLTGGNGELAAAWLGSGAGNALCADAPTALMPTKAVATMAAVIGTIK
ncbi:hypothetical protein ABIA40_005438 [Bradyrhizobium sp. USDA 223]